MRSMTTFVFLALAIAACAPESGGGAPGKPQAWTGSFTRPGDAAIRSALTREQYEITQHAATESPFQNAYWDQHEPGIYVDVVSGEPLFSSLDKFDSGTGWPSFTRPLETGNIVLKEDRQPMLGLRTEVRSKFADSHLGHRFDDGPPPTGQRYCMNSGALRFVPAAELEAQGYGQYRSLFSDTSIPSPRGDAMLETATFAGGCFWGMQELLRQVPGVISSEVGYTGGTTDHADYQHVHTGTTGHAEAVRLRFDPALVSYEQILDWFFRIHHPTTINRQGNDRGTQYRSAIFFHDEAQRQTAERMKEIVDRSGYYKSKVVTQIVPAGPWYRAEDGHQDYLERNPDGYTCHYPRPVSFLAGEDAGSNQNLQGRSAQ